MATATASTHDRAREHEREKRPDEQQGSVILRIKRKRGTDPVTALRIFQHEDAGQLENGGEAGNTEAGEPSEALSPSSPTLEDPSRTKRRMLNREAGSMSIFRFAQRVSLDRFKDRDAAASIHREIRGGKQQQPSVTAPRRNEEDLHFRVVRQQQQREEQKKEAQAQAGAKARSKRLLVDALKKGKRTSGTLSTSSSSSSLRALKRSSVGSSSNLNAASRSSRKLKAPPEVM